VIGSHPAVGYVAGFGVYVGLMAIERMLPFPPQAMLPVRVAAAVLVLLAVSRPYIRLRPAFPLGSIAIGAAVFLIWVGPDVLFGYRHHWLFENSITGEAASTLPDALRGNIPFLVLRTVASFALVPILEELFWRGWLMRWLIRTDFQKVPLGAYAPGAFWIVALLFAAEHGPYWEVGLIAGVVYNWWMVRTRSLADCIWAHAVTNALLAAYVVATGNWQYWL
jgi:CAAX prenyl protease-like protein